MTAPRIVIPSEVQHIYADIYAERKRQLDKWGEQHRALGTGTKSYQNKAEAARKRCDAAEKNSQSDDVKDKAPWSAVLEEEFFEAMAESDFQKIREELVQVAAVAVAIIEDIDANYAPNLADTTIYL